MKAVLAVSFKIENLLMNKDLRHPEGRGNGTSMLTTSSSKAGQNMLRSVIAFHLCECSDWATHGLVCNIYEANGNFLHCQRLFACSILLGVSEFIYLKGNLSYLVSSVSNHSSQLLLVVGRPTST